MIELWFTLFVIVLAATLLYGLADPVRFYEFPYFMAATFAVFVLPQAISLIRFPGFATEAAVEYVMLMTFGCLAVCIVAYRFVPIHRGARSAALDTDENRLLAVGIFYALVAAFFNYLISQMSSEERGGTQWTGRATIYLFFASVNYIAMAILFRHALWTRQPIHWILFGISLSPPVVSAIFGGRRENTAHLVISVAMMLYFQRRKVPPRVMVAGAIVFATLAIPATGKYRAIAGDQAWDRLQEFNLIENFKDFLQETSVLELRNAAVMIETTKYSRAYGLGASYWDIIIFRFVPAQFVGKDFKASLMIEGAKKNLPNQRMAEGYNQMTGSTVTGMGDSFSQFGFLGALFFIFPAWVFKTLWQRATCEGDIFAQLLYIGTFTSGMRTITHQTVDFLPGLIYQIIFVGAAHWYSRDPVAKSEPKQKLARPRNTGRS